MTTHKSPQRNHRRSAALAIAAGVLGGGAIGLVGTIPGFASAASPDVAIAAPSDDNGDSTENDTSTDTDTDTGNVAATDQERGPGHRGGKGRMGDAEGFASALGLDSAEELKTAFEAGTTPAEIAEANGVDLDSVREYLRAQMQERLDAAVADGKIDQTEADERAAGFDERIDAILNGERANAGRAGAGRAGEGARGGRGSGGDQVDDTTVEGASTISEDSPSGLSA